MEDVPCTYRISLKAVVKDGQGRVLLLREKDGAWELPGGGLEHGEDPRAALTREIAEETGMQITWMSGQPAAFWTIHKEVGSPRLKWFAFVAYEVQLSGAFQAAPDSDEAQEAQYFTAEEARVLQLHDNTKPYFRQRSGSSMKLFLSSQAISKAQAPHLIELVGKPARDIKLALIENAAGVEPGPKAWLARNRKLIMSHGFDVELLDLNDYRGKAAELRQKLATKDVVWLGGGNTFYLRWLLHETGADTVIRELAERGLTYGGGSAGAIVAGPTLKYFETADDPAKAPNLLLDGLHLTETVMVPHADNEKYAPIVKSISQKLKADGRQTALLKDAQALVVHGSKQKVIVGTPA